MENIIYSINGTDYVLFSIVYLVGQQERRIKIGILTYKGIVQSTDIEESFWNGSKTTIKVLIPELYATSFSQLVFQ